MHLHCVDVINTSCLPGFGAGAATTELFGMVECVLESPCPPGVGFGLSALRRERNTVLSVEGALSEAHGGPGGKTTQIRALGWCVVVEQLLPRSLLGLALVRLGLAGCR